MSESPNTDKKVDGENIGNEDITKGSKSVKSKKKRRKRKQKSRISRLYTAILTNNVTHPQSVSYAIYERGPVRLYRSSFRKSFYCPNQSWTAESLPTEHRFCIFPFDSHKDDDEKCPKFTESSPTDKSELTTRINEQKTRNNLNVNENPREDGVRNSRTLLQSNSEQDKNGEVKNSATEKDKDLVINPSKGTNQKESDSEASPMKSFLLDKKKVKSMKRETSSKRLKFKDAEFRALLEKFKEIPKLSTEEDIPEFMKVEREAKLEHGVDYSNEVFVEDNQIRNTGDVSERQGTNTSKDPYFDFENDRFQHFEEESNEIDNGVEDTEDAYSELRENNGHKENFDRMKDDTHSSEFDTKGYEDDYVLLEEEERLRREKVREYEKEYRAVHNDHLHGDEPLDEPFGGIYSDSDSTRQGKYQNQKENIREKQDWYVSVEGKGSNKVKSQMEYQTVETLTSKEAPEQQEKNKQQTSSGSIWERGNEEKLYQRYGLGRNSHGISSATNLDIVDTKDEEKVMYHPLKRKFKFGYMMQYPWEAFVRYTCDKSEEPPQDPMTSQSHPYRGPIRIIFDAYGRPIILRPPVPRPENEGGYSKKWSPFGMPFDFPELSDEELAGNDVYVQLSVSYAWYRLA